MILIVQSLWNESITSKLVGGAKKILTDKKQKFEIIQVPGALEIPLAVKWAWSAAQRNQKPFLGAIACGVIIQGDTYHFHIVANESARALMDLSLELRLPIANGILACFNEDQAVHRTKPPFGNKGEEAAEALLQMIELKNKKEY